MQVLQFPPRVPDLRDHHPQGRRGERQEHEALGGGRLGVLDLGGCGGEQAWRVDIQGPAILSGIQQIHFKLRGIKIGTDINDSYKRINV